MSNNTYMYPINVDIIIGSILLKDTQLILKT